VGRTGIYACGESVSRCNSSESVVLFSWKQEAPASIGGGTFTSDTDERLANRARHNIKLSLDFDDSKYSGVTASLWQDWLLNYHYELGSETNDTHLNTLNFVVNKTFKNGLSAYVGVDNIFDQKNENLFADGRVYRFGMKYTF